MDKYVVLPGKEAKYGDAVYSEGQIIHGLLKEHALFLLKCGSIRPFEEEIDAPQTETPPDPKGAKKTK
jgi:hypothetical protein